MSSYATGKEKILDAALREFADRGFEGARMDRIAAEAGVNKALIYYHFKSKEELYVAAIDHVFAKALPEPKPAEGVSLKDNFLRLLAQFVTFLHENPVFIKMMDRETLRGGASFRKAHKQLELYREMLALYERGVGTGEFRRLDHPGDYIVSMLGACYFFYSHRNNVRMFYPESLTEEELLQMRIRTLQDMTARVFFAD